MTTDFEPRIIGFLCRWCSYAGADLAGTSRLKYTPLLRVIRVLEAATESLAKGGATVELAPTERSVA